MAEGSMARAARRPGAGAALGGLLLLLGGCTAWNDGTYRVADAVAGTGQRIGAPWGGMRPRSPEDALTIQRLRGAALPPDQLRPEPGDVWPGPLPQRSTLANPDAALRGIPEYTPLPGSDPNAPPPPGNTSAIPRPPGPNRGSSSPPPPVMTTPPPPPQQLIVPPPQPRAVPGMPPRADGQVIVPPSGPPVVTSGGTDRVQSYNVPGGGSGTAIRDGNTTTLIGPDGRVQVVPGTPR